MAPSSLDQFHLAFPELREPCLAPRLPVVDAHHHFFPASDPKPRPPQFLLAFGRVRTDEPHLPEDMLRDAALVNVVTTVHVEAGRFYDDRPPEKRFLNPVGETAKVAGMHAQSGGRLCRGIVAKLDLALSRADLLEAVAAHRVQALLGGGCLLVGVRQSVAHDALNEVVSAAPAQAALDAKVVDGARCMGELGLTVDVWLYHTQLAEFAWLAEACPGTTFVCDHVAMPIRVGSRAQDLGRVFWEWRLGMVRLSQCGNVVIKLGGLTMNVSGLCKGAPYSSADLAAALNPFFALALALFPGRCMFESNWPMDKGGVSYVNFWNACMRLTRDASLDERRDLFYECANRTYKLGLPARAANEFVIPQTAFV
jgi:L-fuconolactonase